MFDSSSALSGLTGGGMGAGLSGISPIGAAAALYGANQAGISIPGISGGGFPDVLGAISGASGTSQGINTIAAATPEAQAAMQQALQQGTGAVQAGTQQGVGALQHGMGQQAGALNQYYGGAVGALSPYYQTGTGAQNEIANLMGVNGAQAQNAAYGRFQADPSYKFSVGQANQALQRSAMSQGNLFSGNFAAASDQLNQGLASQQFGNYYNRLMGMAGQGQQAGAGIANILTGQGAGLANIYGTGAQGTANLYAGQGGQLAGLYGGYGTNLANLYTGQAAAIAQMQQAKGQQQANLYGNILSSGAGIAGALLGGA